MQCISKIEKLPTIQGFFILIFSTRPLYIPLISLAPSVHNPTRFGFSSSENKKLLFYSINCSKFLKSPITDLSMISFKSMNLISGIPLKTNYTK